MKRSAILIAVGLILLLLSCSNSGTSGQKTGGKTAQPTQDTILFTTVSNPDELFLVAKKNYSVKEIAAALDTTATIAATDRNAVAFAIGVRTANALLASVTGDMTNAQAIAGGVKEAAAKLNITSDRIESLANQLKTDLTNTTDEAVKERKAREDLDKLSNEFVTVLKGVGGGYESVLIQLGGWTEGLRIGTKVILGSAKFDGAVVGALLSRKAEATWFLGQVQGMDKAAAGTQDLAAQLKVITAAMEPSADGKLTKAQVTAIQKAVAAVQSLFAK